MANARSASPPQFDFLCLNDGTCHVHIHTDSFSSLRRVDIAGCTLGFFFSFICAMVGLRRKTHITKSNSTQTQQQQQHVGKQIRALRDACVARAYILF